ncbi:GTP 3',8-cyclase MoaA [Saccharopolyspora dendranthemae]|uniref:GTP 3',8-cyclase n=1 Tax=Saccharopolyspora dendranthemae TaxID=1181886 RepID=A0A561TZF8_9PSEU|nr:GTP 3',8-cyclase MoaA [Saccharopolyspora dendranthemae]TWF92497.1 cyclic pyranopterin monophosphate synthase subunit MoaA [Saccharopolyspora dendranthemae]
MNAVDLGIPFVRRTTDTSERPDTQQLVDRFGRVATDLRVSLIDKCNLRCTYCMPAEGLPWLKRDEMLDTDEMNRLIRIAVEELGVNTVRFTGGEPLLRQDLVDVIAATSSLPSRPTTSLTTNGINLGGFAEKLVTAGLNRVNVSLDTLDRAVFKELTRRDRMQDVLDGLAAAKTMKLEPVKVNAVLMRGVNDHEAPELLRFCIERGYQLRFIEQMPLDAQHGWERSAMITADEILELLGAEFTLTPDVAERGSAPAERWLVDGGPATVGVIASVTRPFCAACDRTRLTADGQLRSCLFSTTETDLRGPMREGATDDELARLWQGEMWAKAAGHGMDSGEFAQPSRPMSAIGG